VSLNPYTLQWNIIIFRQCPVHIEKQHLLSSKSASDSIKANPSKAFITGSSPSMFQLQAAVISLTEARDGTSQPISTNALPINQTPINSI